MENKTYNGWRNRATWNVALWLGNDYPIYRVASGYSKYATPFLSLRRDLKETFGYTHTKDNYSLVRRELDINELDTAIREMSE